MKTERRALIAQQLSKVLPPIVAQWTRTLIYPLALARKSRIDFIKKSITGSYLKCNTIEFHAYNFYIHGYNDWRNVIIANSVSKYTKGDFIEIGANVGTETVSFCDIVNGYGKVHAFEPLPSNIKYLKKLSETQNSLNIFEYALSNKDGEVRFWVPPEQRSGAAKILRVNIDIDKNAIVVKTKKLDDFLGEFNNVNFISIDTEGHEPFVLKGGKNTLIKHNPIVVLEVSPKLLVKYANLKPKFIKDFFEDLNYNLFKIEKISISKITQNDLLTDKSHNWVCIPKNQKKIENQIKRDLMIRSLIPWFLLKKIPNASL
jgi:FkbM family methyltransferase